MDPLLSFVAALLAEATEREAEQLVLKIRNKPNVRSPFGYVQAVYRAGDLDRWLADLREERRREVLASCNPLTVTPDMPHCDRCSPDDPRRMVPAPPGSPGMFEHCPTCWPEVYAAVEAKLGAGRWSA